MHRTELTTCGDPLSGDGRYPIGIPHTDNGNYFGIQHFNSALNRTRRGGLFMANSAADARASEQEIPEKIIRSGHQCGMAS